MKRNRLFLVVLLAVLVAGCWYTFAPSHTPAPQPAITKLTQQNFSQFKSTFDHDTGSVRLILLLSPT